MHRKLLILFQNNKKIRRYGIIPYRFFSGGIYMKKILKVYSAVFFCGLLMLTGCGEKTEKSSETVQVAGENETAPVQELEIPDGDPVYASDLNDGVYDIKVDSSSSMFSITECSLEVSKGKMNAVMTMGGKGYLYVFMGKGENASDESEYIPFEENSDGIHNFKVPVESLDTAIECSAYSKKKEKWYDRTLVFRSDSLPAKAFKNMNTAESLGLKDGEYTVDVEIEGGSGKANINSPAKLIVESGQAYAEIVWSSSNYDYMIVDDEKFEPINTESNSAFKIPVSAFDRKITVSADTTAMSTPHEIEYTLYFDSESIKP